MAPKKVPQPPANVIPIIGGQARRLTPEKQELLKQARSIFQIAPKG